MKIDLSFSGTQFDELQLRDKNVIVIDVLRASTTITAALANGAREIIPVATIENAVKISGSLFGDVTLRGGERFGKMIEGFNLGNSPAEYTEAAVKGKSIIYCTTNGSVAIARSKYARRMVIGSFVNLTKTVEFIREVNGDFLIVCAGNHTSLSNFSLEDSVCAGLMIHRLMQSEGISVELTDSSRAALVLYKSFGRSIAKMLKTADHGQFLIEAGFGTDLAACGDIDSIPVLPIFSGNAIRLRKDGTHQAEEEHKA